MDNKETEALVDGYDIDFVPLKGSLNCGNVKTVPSGCPPKNVHEWRVCDGWGITQYPILRVAVTPAQCGADGTSASGFSNPVGGFGT